MFCRNCGQQMEEAAACCIHCGVAKGSGDKFCPNCGAETTSNQAMCVKCGVSLSSRGGNGSKIGKSSGSFKRASDGKLLGGVFSGAEKTYGINRWIGRAVSIFIPFWPIWLIAYIAICCSTEIE